MRKNLRHLRNLRDKLIFSEKKKTAEKKKEEEIMCKVISVLDMTRERIIIVRRI